MWLKSRFPRKASHPLSKGREDRTLGRRASAHPSSEPPAEASEPGPLPPRPGDTRDPRLLPASSPGQADTNGSGPSRLPPSPESSRRAGFSERWTTGREMPGHLAPQSESQAGSSCSPELPGGGSAGLTSPSCRSAWSKVQPLASPCGLSFSISKETAGQAECIRGGRSPKGQPRSNPLSGDGQQPLPRF